MRRATGLTEPLPAGPELLEEIQVADVLGLGPRAGEAHADQLGVQHPPVRQVDVGQPGPVRRVALAIELEAERGLVLQLGPWILQRPVADDGIDADQPNALERPAEPLRLVMAGSSSGGR